MTPDDRALADTLVEQLRWHETQQRLLLVRMDALHRDLRELSGRLVRVFQRTADGLDAWLRAADEPSAEDDECMVCWEHLQEASPEQKGAWSP